MPMTDAEFAFLDAYVHEVYTPAMTGPHTRAVRGLGANQSDLAWLLTAWHRKALVEGKNPLVPLTQSMCAYRGLPRKRYSTGEGNYARNWNTKPNLLGRFLVDRRSHLWRDDPEASNVTGPRRRA